MKKITSTIFSFMMLCLITQAAWAATLGIYPEQSEINVNDQIDLTIEGTGFTQFPDHIGVTLSWNPTVLSYTGTTFAKPPWDNSFIDETAASDGIINSIFAESATGAEPDFLLARLQFTALAPGSADIVLGTSGGNCIDGFIECGALSGGTQLLTDYSAATVNVVPIPAAVWLFGAGLLGLIGFVRRN